MRSSWTFRLPLVIYGVGVLIYRDSLMDDTFIHLQYARNLRELHEISFNAGEPSLGLTSPFWVMILSLLGSGLNAARLASVGFGALSVVVFVRLAQRFTATPVMALAASVAWAGSLWLIRHAPNGMEASCSVFWVLWALDLRTRSTSSRWHELLFGVSVALALLTRPEAALFALTYFVYDLIRAKERNRLLYWFPVVLLITGAWVVFSVQQTGHAIPDTGSAKSGGFGWNLGVWSRVVWREGRILASDQIAELAGVFVAGLMILRWRSRSAIQAIRQHPLLPYSLFSVLVLIGFMFTDVQVQPRYLLPTVPCWTLLGFLGWQTMFGSGARVGAMVAVLSLVMTAVSSAIVVFPSTMGFSRSLRTGLIPLAHEIRARGGESTCVATPDIGVIGYYSKARVLDLGGLTEPRIQELVAAIGYDSMLVSGRFQEFGPAQFVLDRSRTPERFSGLKQGTTRWKPIRNTQLDNLGISRPGPFYYTLYQLVEDPDQQGNPATP